MSDEPVTFCRIFHVGPICPHPCADCKRTDALLTPDERARLTASAFGADPMTLVDAGWVEEERVQWGVQLPSGAVDQFWLRKAAEEWRAGRPLSTTLVTRTRETATRTTAWKEAGR